MDSRRKRRSRKVYSTCRSTDAFGGSTADLIRTAGSDTSATAMRATLLCIMTSPRVYRTLMAEIDDALARGKIPSGPKDIITEAQAKEVPYLQACIKEVRRDPTPSVL